MPACTKRPENGMWLPTDGLVYFYKIVEGLVPAIPCDKFLEKQTNKQKKLADKLDQNKAVTF